MADITQGQLVWFDIGIGYPVPGKVIDFSQYHNFISIETRIDNKTHIYRMDTMANVEKREDTGPDGVDDMISLPDLNEASVLHNLKKRYINEHIYTYTGSILVAVNPYKMFDVYGLDMVKRYEGQVLGTLPPHLFAIGNDAYMKMIKDDEKQVIVISGESGAGKTESTKLLLHYLAAVNQSKNNLVTEQILEANPLLESFGNAKTIRNDNSSRFGKYVEVYFKNCAITGARISEYLLEKSRIVTHSEDERSYHVFYEILTGMTDRQKTELGLSAAENYFYLNQGGSCSIETKNDEDDYRALQSAMQILNFTEDEQKTIYKILAAVLHMGNIFFRKKVPPHIEGPWILVLASDTELRWVSHLLDLDEQWLYQVLTMKVTEARGERVLSPYTLDQAIDARDAISKGLYSQLFTWLVEKMNSLVQTTNKKHSIAILDIFGFEDFYRNKFEQLCINYANETLQYYFNKHIFKLEQQEYSKEHINWSFIDFSDNQAVLDLLAKKPVGIIHLLDDESNFPKGTDQSYLDKCHYNHYANDLYEKPRMAGPEFCITHYAGKITYTVTNFLEKNKDTLRTDVVDLLTQSRNHMISQMFHDWRNRSLMKTVNKATGRFVTMRPTLQTVASRFHESLLKLIEQMSKCNPYFIRCIKPNNEKTPMNFKMPVVLDQLRYTGMLETIRIRKQGYPIRIKFKQFIDRFHALLGPRKPKQQQQKLSESQYCEIILTHSSGKYAEHFQIGLSKVFLKESFSSYIEVHLMRVQQTAALHIQRILKGTFARKEFLRKKASVLVLQKHIRGYQARTRWRKLKCGVVLLQALSRMKSQQKKFIVMRDEMRRQRKEEEKLLKQSQVEAKLIKAADPRFKSPKDGSFNRVPTRLEQREMQERAARAMVNVAHLEVPPRLAVLFGQQDQWQPLHSDRNIVTVVGNITQTESNEYSLPYDINAHTVAKLRNVFLKAPGDWGMRTEPIDQPFTVTDADDAIDAVALFKLILRFMNDANLVGWRETLLGDYIVQMVLENGRLRDEIYSQLINQTWQNNNEANNERGWLLMANCLSTFPPTPRLYKYLLKYVSDYAYNGFKSVCQHKMLQMMKNDAVFSRTYPPCMLEWKANRKRAHMALEVKFTDGTTGVGAVNSWMTGEEFASRVLKSRNLMESNHGWSVQLLDDDDVYELAGYNYILDLISEMEIPPHFPCNQAYFLVSPSKSRDRKASRIKTYANTPHNPDLPRIFKLDSNTIVLLPSDTPQSPVITSARRRRRSSSSPSPTRSPPVSPNESLVFSQESKLNQRPATIGEESGLARQSRLNSRYIKRSAPVPPVLPPSGSPPQRQNDNLGLSNSSQLNQRYRNIAEVNSDLARSKLNDRYYANGIVVNNHVANCVAVDYDVPNGHVTGGHFIKSPQTTNVKPGGQTARDKILHKTASQERERTTSTGSEQYDAQSTSQPAPSEISRMVDELFDFDQDIDESLDDLTDGPRMVRVMRGGGEGVPGLNQTAYMPQAGTGVMNLGMNNVAMGNQLMNPPISAGFGTVPLVNPGLGSVTPGLATVNPNLGNPYLHMQAQQIATQQANLNQAAHQIASQNATMAQMEQQQQVLHAAVQQQALQNQLLQYSLQGEILKQQLQQIATPTGSQPTPSTSSNHLNQPSLSERRKGVSAPSPIVIPQGPGHGNRAAVRNLKEHYESQSPPERVTSPQRKISMVKFSEDVQTIPGVEGSPITSPVTSPKVRRSPTKTKPGSPVKTSSPGPRSPTKLGSPVKTSSPGLGSPMKPGLPVKRTAPPPPPPPPPVSNGHISDSESSDQDGAMLMLGSSVKIDRQKSMATPSPPPTDDERVEVEKLPGRATTIRVGHVCWPPKPNRDHRHKVHVGKLFIEEKPVKTHEITGAGAVAHRDQVEQETMELIRTQSASRENIKKAAEIGIASALAKLGKDPKTDKLDGGEKPPEKIDTGVKIDMKQRAMLLQWKMSSLNKDEDEPEKTQTEPIPIPLPPPEFRTGPIEARQSPERASIPKPPPLMPFVSPKSQQTIETIVSQLHSANSAPFYMYTRVPWQIQIRKEVFSPSERLDNPLALTLIFCQVAQDVFVTNCVRINKDERVKMRSLLESHGVTSENFTSPTHKSYVKKMVVEAAREWPVYFSRLFPVMCEKEFVDTEMIAVSHSGVRYIRREKDFVDESLTILQHIRFEQIIDVTTPKTGIVIVNTNDKLQHSLFSPRATEIKQLIEAYCIDSEKGTVYVRALNTYHTRESTLLSFQSGDLIKVTSKDRHLAHGWMYGSLNGRAGMFPVEHVERVSRHEITRKGSKLVRPISTGAILSDRQVEQPQPSPRRHSVNGSVNGSMHSAGSATTNLLDAKYTMMEFALQYFRESPNKYEMLRKSDGSIRGTFKLLETIKSASLRNRSKKGSKKAKGNWSWKEIAEMIKWTKSPIQASLLKWHSSTANKLALECFIAIMKYMGDYPLAKNQTDLDCVYIVLMACHNTPDLRDEVYCQLCKQSTNNRSKKAESGMKGWRLFGVLTAYFDCSEILRPYLIQFLQTASHDSKREYHGLSAIALANFRKTLKSGGRKNVPSRTEIDALTRGRLTKRQMFLLPGGYPMMLNVRSVTVAEDVIDDICTTLNMTNALEQNEYTIYYVVEKEHFHAPMNVDEYIFDITTELAHQNREYHLLFQRTTWYYDIRYDYSDRYIDVMYNQSLSTYLSGNLLVMEQQQLSNQQMVEISKLAALQYKAIDRIPLPSLREVMELLPKGIEKLSDLPVQSWVNLVHGKITELSGSTPIHCKTVFLEMLSKWKLFGSKFFKIMSVADPRVPDECLLAINKHGIHFLNSIDHVTYASWSLNEVISTRRYRADGPHACHLDLKVGSLMMQKIIRIETNQGVDISRILGQYIRVMNLDRQQSTTPGVASMPSMDTRL
ncbi:unconventional myosin-XV-like [Tubulanus polymorphus]|uniref:unconventional myosin-XV-like n=1 Tax=Tubulanus polymorphus TaxID=672921 RepID=UPI003DA414BF